MKTSPFIVLIAVLFAACSDINVSDMGSQLLPPSDQMTVSADTFSVRSDNYVVPYIYAYPDSFLLGTFYDQKFGTTHADIFAQVEKPAKYVYPDSVTIVPDSIYLIMYYKRYFGDKYSPMHISVYEMNKATFNYTTAYPSNLNPAVYTDKSLLIGQKTVTAVNALIKGDSTAIAIKLSSDFLNRFTSAGPDIYNDENKFLEFFKGLHITTDFGSATMFYINQIGLEYFHHYTYSTKGSAGQDTTIKVNNVIPFPANDMVRQVNRFMHPDTTQVLNNLSLAAKQIHHISAPANLFTKVQLPLRAMHKKMESPDKRTFINSAKLRIDIAEFDDAKIARPVSANLLLIKENAMHRFFAKKELPNDTISVIGTYTPEFNSVTKEYDYYYEFDLSRYIANEFRTANHKTELMPEWSDFVVVPVRITYGSNSVVSKVRHQILMNGVTIAGGQHPDKPMLIKTIYSKF
jgi:hypothetical protein